MHVKYINEQWYEVVLDEDQRKLLQQESSRARTPLTAVLMQVIRRGFIEYFPKGDGED